RGAHVDAPHGGRPAAAAGRAAGTGPAAAAGRGHGPRRRGRRGRGARRTVRRAAGPVDGGPPVSGARATATPPLGPPRTPACPLPAADPWSADPYADALRAGRGPLFLRRTDGWLLPLDVERWCAEPDPADLDVLGRCEGAVLDVGCGPGRLVAALGARGHRALGIDVSEAAVAHTVGRGGQALLRSVFDPLPGTGRWGTALLAD